MYQCEHPHPQCDYQTTLRSQIHYHHIIPKECGGGNGRDNRIWLCPTHHTHIFVPEAKQGHHAQQSEHSIILIGWRKSTGGGHVLLYRKISDPESEVRIYET